MSLTVEIWTEDESGQRISIDPLEIHEITFHNELDFKADWRRGIPGEPEIAYEAQGPEKVVEDTKKEKP